MSGAPPRYQLRSKLPSPSPTVQRYEASQTGLDRLVEIRVARRAMAEGSPDQRRWKLVLKTLATVDHACLLKVLDTGVIEERPYYVVDLRKARSLAELRAEAARPMPPKRLFAMARRLAEGLGQLHGKGLLLREIAADTILFDEDTDLPYFAYYHGLVPATQGGGHPSDEEKEFLSPTFLHSPEVLRKLPVSPRTDLYLLGCTLYHLVTGRNPLDHERVYGADGVNPAWDFPQASTVVPGIPEGVDALLSELTRPDPEERPADAAAFVELVDRAEKKLEVADQLSRSMVDARKAVTLDLSASMARKADQKKRKGDEDKSASARPDLVETARLITGDPKLQLGLMVCLPLVLLGGLVFLVAQFVGGPSAPVSPTGRGPATSTPTRSAPRPPTRSAPAGKDLASLSKEVEALANELSSTPTSKKNFLKRWNVLKRWIILVDVSERKKHLFSYAQIVNAKILYFSSAEKACKDLDGFIEKAGSYLRTR